MYKLRWSLPGHVYSTSTIPAIWPAAHNHHILASSQGFNYIPVLSINIVVSWIHTTLTVAQAASCLLDRRLLASEVKQPARAKASKGQLMFTQLPRDCQGWNWYRWRKRNGKKSHQSLFPSMNSHIALKQCTENTFKLCTIQPECRTAGCLII